MQISPCISQKKGRIVQLTLAVKKKYKLLFDIFKDRKIFINMRKKRTEFLINIFQNFLFNTKYGSLYKLQVT